MMIVRLTVLVGMLFAITGCVIPLGKPTGPDDDRSPYFSNDGDHSSDPTTQFRSGPFESLN